MGNNYLIIRADADARMGAGHLMRCLALGQAWKDAGGRIIFITSCADEWLLQRLCSEGFTVHRLGRPYPDDQDWGMTEHLLSENPNSWLVLDGYHFDSDYQKRVKEAGYRLMVIDDTGHLPHYYGDIVLNQNIHAKDLCYSCEPYAKLLLGPQYVLLRREFLKWRGWKREIPEIARKVLVTLGGSDPDDVTLKVIRALQNLEIDALEATIVAGGSNPNFGELQSAVRASRLPMRLESNVTNMPELMAWADVAVSGGGSTCWELAFMGLPDLVSILADNQIPIAGRLEEMGSAVNLGWYENLSSSQIARELKRLVVAAEKRAGMAHRGQELVDGKGTTRVLTHMRVQTLSLRKVREEDRQLLWEWATDPDVRAGSFSSEPIPWEEHVLWFKSKLNDPHCIFYIATNGNDVPIGQARYDVDRNESVVSVSVDRNCRGKGYGSAIICLASHKLFDTSDVSVIHAYVKDGNEPSVRAFVKAGFKNMGMAEFRGYRAIHLVLRKEDLT